MTDTIPGLSAEQAALMATLMGETAPRVNAPAAPSTMAARPVTLLQRATPTQRAEADEREYQTMLAGQLSYQRAQRDARRQIEAEDRPTVGLDGLRAALLDSAGLDTVPPLVPLIGKDFMFTDSLVWLIGKPGSMKSFVALDIAGHVGGGTWWQGQPTNGGPVLYVLAEGMSGTRQRVRAWEQQQRRQMTGVHFLAVAVQAGSPADWDALVALVAEMRPRLVVIDTQARVTVGLEENSNTEMGRFVHQLDRLRQASGACVMAVHHLTRNGDNGRGASAIDGAMTTIVKVDKADSTITLECAKSKDGAEWAKITLRPVPVGESVVLTYVSEHETPDDTVVRCHSWLQVWYERHRDEWVSVATLTDSKGGPAVVAKNTFHTNKFKLIDAGAIERDGEGRNTRYRLAPSSVPGPIWVLSPALKGGGTGTQYPNGPTGLSGTDTGLGTHGEGEAGESPAHAPAAPPDDLGPSVPTKPRRARRGAEGSLALRALTGK